MSKGEFITDPDEIAFLQAMRRLSPSERVGTSIAGLAVMSLTGCVSFSEPVQATPDTYLITMDAHSGLQGSGELLTETIQRANTLCASQGRHAVVQTTEGYGVQGWPPQENRGVFSHLQPRS